MFTQWPVENGLGHGKSGSEEIVRRVTALTGPPGSGGYSREEAVGVKEEVAKCESWAGGKVESTSWTG